MRIRFLQHLPSLALESNETFELCDGWLAALPYEGFLSVDPSYRVSREVYERSNPVFFMAEATCDPSERAKQIKSLETTVTDLHLALCLSNPECVFPEPTTSIKYIVSDDNVEIGAGVVQRELMLHGDIWKYTLHKHQLQRTDALFNYLADFHEIRSFRPLRKLVDVLYESTRIENVFKGIGSEHSGPDLLFSFVGMVKVMESVLFADLQKRRFSLSLTKSFGLYWALLLEPDKEKLRTTADRLSSLYRLRSQIVHGQPGLSPLDKLHQEAIYYCRALFMATIKILIILVKTRYGLRMDVPFDELPWASSEPGEITAMLLNPLRDFLDSMLLETGTSWEIREETYAGYHRHISETWKTLHS